MHSNTLISTKAVCAWTKDPLFLSSSTVEQEGFLRVCKEVFWCFFTFFFAPQDKIYTAQVVKHTHTIFLFVFVENPCLDPFFCLCTDSQASLLRKHEIKGMCFLGPWCSATFGASCFALKGHGAWRHIYLSFKVPCSVLSHGLQSEGDYRTLITRMCRIEEIYQVSHST